MAFSQFNSIEELASKYSLEYRREPFVEPVAGLGFSAGLLSELEYTIRMVPYQRSEILTREAVIYPILRDVCKRYDGYLTLLSGETVIGDNDLRGEVDYVVCRRSKLGPLVPDVPYLLIGEAKKDDVSGGWNQALGGMIAAQKISGPGFTYFGITTFGTAWRFGKLERSTFTQDADVYGIGDRDRLAGALHFVLGACRDQLLTAPAT